MPKVRSRIDPKLEFELIEETQAFYIVKHGPLAPIAVLRKDWELVPTKPTYIDVTAECGVVSGHGERDGIKHFGPGNAVCMIYGGYRLRKVSLAEVIDKYPEQRPETIQVFLVEQRADA